MKQRPKRRPAITTFELTRKGDLGGHKLTPTRVFAASFEERASDRVGHVAYAIVRSQALAAIPAQSRALDRLHASFSDEVDRVKALSPAEQTAADSDLRKLGHATHWEAIVRLGLAVETIAMFAAGWEAFAAGRREEIADVMLGRDLDLLRVLQEKRRSQLGYWDRLAAVPARDDLIAAGLLVDEARVVRAGYRSGAMNMLRRFLDLRDFYTAPLHQVYSKYKHGYTLIDPAVSPLQLRVKDPRGGDLDRAMAEGFAVMHRTRTGTILLEIVRSKGEDLIACLNAASDALVLADSFATSWLPQIEHEHSRTITMEASPDMETRALQVSGLRKWISDGFAGAYDLEDVLGELERRMDTADR